MNEKLLIELNESIKKLNENVEMFNRQVFSAKQAAKYLSIGYETLLAYTRIGEITYVPNGVNYIYKKEFLDQWLDKNKKVKGA